MSSTTTSTAPAPTAPPVIPAPAVDVDATPAESSTVPDSAVEPSAPMSSITSTDTAAEVASDNVPATAVESKVETVAEVVPSTTGEAKAVKAEVKDVGAKATTSTIVADEKAAAGSSSSTATPRAAKPASKKRRKRTGIAAIFVALGCLSQDEFEDDAPNKATPPAHAVKASNTTKVATGVAGATAAAAAGAAVVAARTDTSANASASKDKDGNSGAQKDGSATPSGSSDVVVRPSEPTTAPLEEVRPSPSVPKLSSTPITPSGNGQMLTNDQTAGLTSSAVQAPGSGSEIVHQHTQHLQHRNDSEHHLAGAHADANRTTDSAGYTDLSESEGGDVGDQTELLYGDDDYEDEEDRLIAQGGIGIPLDENGNPAPLLPPIYDIDTGRKCLVLDLDETLLHSSFKMLPSADYIVPVEIESQTHNVYVIKRPGVDHFLQEMGKIYEIVVFTASLSKYADPVLDMLDVGRVVRHRLFRESCYNHKGNYVKDLSQLGRHISTSIIIDNSPASYIFHPNNAVPVSTWFNDPHDTELTDLCPFLSDLATVDDVRGVLDGGI
ncbi:uncharacterized protein EHS24_002570 [Apiotrichum porosum]|uniref:FCP1 homology domain-containing protein n=1 Tax=Apiotrichum porosum TaxID=105984 RepID=A0A427XHC2_9TREE|nr:uncharacterized protein EHS24_002570 [Apiotrichum porosum]RSH78114.1 hypothetical protein EHS24_002570 [Apiotrichum porosum]